jgi:lysophospholipase L1-like esterase
VKKTILVNTLLILTIVFICCLILEGGIRLLYPRFANYNLEMWRYIATLKKPCSNPRLPFVHYPDREGIFYGIPIRTNSMGFRNPEITLEKPADTKRILVLGDSLVFGWGVPMEQTIPYLLETKLNAHGKRCEVINLGVGNYNTTMEVELFKEKGLPLKPDAVILIFFVNDTEPVPGENAWKYAFKQRSFLYAVLFDAYLRLHPHWNTRFNWLDYYSSLYHPNAPALGKNREALRELVRICRERHIAVYTVSYPELHQLEDYPLNAATEYIAGFAKEAGLPFLDLLPVFTPHRPESLWVSPEDAHGNAKASTLAAEAIYQHFGEALMP